MGDDVAARFMEAARKRGLPGIDWVRQTVSTNADLADRPDLRDGWALVTDHQSGGKGRLGRQWSSPPGENLLMSVILWPALSPSQLHLCTLAAAVAIVEAVELDDPEPLRIKWPNDVRHKGKKVAGILAERHGERVVVGIGLNVNWYPEHLPSTSLKAIDGQERDRPELAAAIVHALQGEVRRLELDLPGFIRRWTERSDTIGSQVMVDVNSKRGTDAKMSGKALRIDEHGALWIETPYGTERILAGDVEMIG